MIWYSEKDARPEKSKLVRSTVGQLVQEDEQNELCIFVQLRICVLQQVLQIMCRKLVHLLIKAQAESAAYHTCYISCLNSK